MNDDFVSYEIFIHSLEANNCNDRLKVFEAGYAQRLYVKPKLCEEFHN